MTGHLGRIEDFEPLARKARYSVSALAPLLGFGERQFERRFREDVGITPSKWIESVRMRLAAKLICRGNKTKEVASEVCFKDSSHFIRAFKRVMGLTPLAFFRQHLRDSRQNVG